VDGRQLRPWGELKEKSRSDTVYVDVDKKTSPTLRELWRVLRFIGLRVQWIRIDRTVRGWHVVCRFREKLAPAESVALQFLLGSDREREVFNLARVIRSRLDGRRLGDRWNILYKRKVKK